MRSLGLPGGLLLVLAGLLPAVAIGAGLPDFTKLWDFEHPDSTEAKFEALLPAARASGDENYLGQLLTQVARTQGLQARFDAADSTLATVTPLLREDRPELGVRYLLERGRVRNSAGEPAAAEPLFREAWRAARRAGLDGLAVDAAHMIAIVTPSDSALVWNLRALELVEASPDPQAQGWAGSLYNNLGWTYHDRGDHGKALELFERGLAW